MSAHEDSQWAVGWILFAGIMMIMAGIFQAIAGVAAIARSGLYAVSAEWILRFSVTTWGWVHLVVGVVLAAGGYGVLSGNVAARTLGVALAVISAILNFAWLPWYPVWGLVVIAIDVGVIWALTAHGRDLVDTTQRG